MKYLVSLLLVGAGGFIGSAARFASVGLVHRFTGFAFPWGTVVVNLVGCLVIGLLAGLTETRQLLTPETRLLLMVGLLGGFTTFSTFGLELFSLLRDGLTFRAAAYIGIQVAGGLAAVWIGYSAIR